MKISTKVFLALLFLLAITLAIATRFYKLGQAPAGLYLDEAAQGYNAYSILKTGRDEYGKTFPFIFRSFIDFKTPIYVYLIVPLIPIFGLTTFAVRFPSFFFSILTIPVLYFLVKHLLKDTKDKTLKTFLPAISILLLAISPWHILFGRTNFECNVALFFYVGGLYLFYLALTKPKLLIASAISFAIAIPAYHSQRIVTPLTLLILFFKYREILLYRTHLKYFFVGIICGILISLPTLSIALTPGFLARASGLNIFTSKVPAGTIENYSGFLTSFVNSKLLLSIREFSSLYVSYLTPRNMFILGDYGPRSSFPALSTFFLWQLPFYIYGLYLLVRSKNLGGLKFITLTMLFIAPIPAALTRDPYSTIRALPLVIPQIILISLGILGLFSRLKGRFSKISFLLLSLFLLIYSVSKLYSSVLILNEYYRGKDWDYGWEEVVNVLNGLDPDLPVIVDNARFEPYSQIIFFKKYDPATYQKGNFEVSEGEYYTNMERVRDKRIGNITTRAINWKSDLLIDQYLVGDELAISLQQIEVHKMTLIREILYPDKSVAYRIVRTR